jgi:hypothetical protein
VLLICERGFFAILSTMKVGARAKLLVVVWFGEVDHFPSTLPLWPHTDF